MSIATYLGCNFNVQITDEVTDEPIEIGYFFSDENNRSDVQKKNSPHNYKKS